MKRVSRGRAQRLWALSTGVQIQDGLGGKKDSITNRAKSPPHKFFPISSRFH